MVDEKQARHVLADMQARLARSAYDALDIPAGDVAPDQVRAAFLELTKTYHPAKFARMPSDVYKLANEVFLGLRAAYDQLSRPRNSPVRQSGPLPFLPNKTPAEQVRTPPPTGPSRQPPPRGNVPPPPSAAINPPTQRGVPPAPTTSQARPPFATSQRPATQPATQQIRRITPAGGVPAVSATGPRPAVTQPTATPPATQQIRRTTPAGGVPTVSATGPRAAVTQPTPSAGMPTAKPPEPELAGVYDQFAKGQWEQARTTLNALIALQPRPRYRALLQYSVGREAQLARRLDEARVELQGALEIDPDLQLAKTALAELFTRRK